MVVRPLISDPDFYRKVFRGFPPPGELIGPKRPRQELNASYGVAIQDGANHVNLACDQIGECE